MEHIPYDGTYSPLIEHIPSGETCFFFGSFSFVFIIISLIHCKFSFLCYHSFDNIGMDFYLFSLAISLCVLLYSAINSILAMTFIML